MEKDVARMYLVDTLWKLVTAYVKKLCSANVANDLGFFFFSKTGEIICIQQRNTAKQTNGICWHWNIFTPQMTCLRAEVATTFT